MGDLAAEAEGSGLSAESEAERVLGLGQVGEAATELRERLLPARSDRSAAIAFGTPQPANIGHPTQIATTRGIAAPGAGARIAPTQTAVLISAVHRAASSTRRGCARRTGRPVVNA